MDLPSATWERLVCEWCAHEFVARKVYRQRFCSSSCRARHNGARLKADPDFAERKRQQSLARGLRPPLHTGSGHWNWKGGIAKKHARGDERYRKWRIAVWRKDRFTCQSCGRIGKHLNAHHIRAWSTHPELRYDVANGTTLCALCHDALHGRSSA